MALLLGASTATASELTAQRANPAARLSPAADATEYWTVTALFDEGYRLFVRFGITNEGPGARTAGAIWYLVHPDGHVSEFRNGRTEGYWQLSPDRLYIDVASSTLDLRPPVRQLLLDTTSQGGKIDLRFPAEDAPAATWVSPRERFRTEMLQPAVAIEGTVWARGMPAPVPVRGTATLTHAWVDESAPSVARRHIEFVAHTPELALYLSDLTTPGGEHHRQLTVTRGGAVLYQTTELELALDPPTARAKSERDYPLPARLVARNSRLTLTMEPRRTLLRTNPLDAVPQPFRLLFSLKGKPRWVWAEASFELTLASAADGAPIRASGQGVLVLNFVNPLPMGK